MDINKNKFSNSTGSVKNNNNNFAVRIVKGEGGEIKPAQAKKIVLNKITDKAILNDYFKGVVEGNRTILAKAITLIESNSQKHHQAAQELITNLLPYSGNSIRIGITGIPGSGKSTLIEALGLYLIEQGHRVAVLSVDPSSSVSKGSILGDKTRMERLSQQTNCFIRPSPSGGILGGVSRKTRETIIVCEAAGFNIILIETIGVGQSEIAVRSMVDFFLLVLIAGAGDELQGIKRGVIELADALLINKADGDNETRSKTAKIDYSNAIRYLRPATKGWLPKVLTASALTGKGIPELWSLIENYRNVTIENGEFYRKRKNQALEWTYRLFEDGIKDFIYNDEEIKAKLDEYKKLVLDGDILPTAAAETLLDIFKNKIK